MSPSQSLERFIAWPFCSHFSNSRNTSQYKAVSHSAFIPQLSVKFLSDSWMRIPPNNSRNATAEEFGMNKCGGFGVGDKNKSNTKEPRCHSRRCQEPTKKKFNRIKIVRMLKSSFLPRFSFLHHWKQMASPGERL